MDEGCEDFVLIVSNVGVEGLDRVVRGAVVGEKGGRGLGEGGFDSGVAAGEEGFAGEDNSSVCWFFFIAGKNN